MRARAIEKLRALARMEGDADMAAEKPEAIARVEEDADVGARGDGHLE